MQKTFRSLSLAAACAAFIMAGCSTSSDSHKAANTVEPFGTTTDGKPVNLYTLRNANGFEAKICNYGGIVTTVLAPDRNGRLGDVVLGYDNLGGYLKDSPYFGCMVGRYGNRIARGKFALNGTTYTLATNNPPNALHGGIKGF